MQLPVKISYRGLEKSDQIENLVLDYAERLERFCDHINRCDIAIEQTNHTHQKGNPYRCRIDVTVAPRHELVRSEEHTSELQSQSNLVCRLLLEKKNNERAPSSSGLPS